MEVADAKDKIYHVTNLDDWFEGPRISTLSEACADGDLQRVRDLICGELDKTPSRTQTPLAWACCNGHLKVVKVLLDNSAFNVNERDFLGMTALMYACTRGRLEIVEYLIEYGADTRLKSLNGKTAMIHALLNGSSKIASLLAKTENVCSENGTGETSLMCACYSNSVEIVKILVENLIPTKETENACSEALIVSSAYGFTELGKVLLKHSNVNYQKFGEKTALLTAIDYGNTELAILLASVSDVNVQYGGKTALMLACITGNLEIVTAILISSTESVFVEDCNRLTAFHFAVNSKKLEIVEMICTHFTLSQIDFQYCTDYGTLKITEAIRSRL